MKKRFLSLILVFVFILSFPVSASAVSPLEQTQRNVERLLEMAQETLQNNWNWTKEQFSNFFHDADEYEPVNDDTGWAADLKPIEFYLNMAATYCNAPTPTAGNYHYMIWAMSYSGYYQVNVRLIYDTNHYNDWNYYLNYYNQPCVTRANNATFDCIYAQIPDNTMFGGNACSVANGGYYTNSRDCNTNQDMDSPYVYCYATDMVDAPLIFTSQISVTDQHLIIMLDSNKIVDHDLFAFGGILYDDGSDRYDGTDRGFINSDFVAARSLQGGQHWEWSFDLDSFSEWAYRKRIFSLPNFYGFVDVHEGGLNNHFIRVLYSDQQALNLSDPTGIFEDVQPMPDYDDYKPTPSPFPTFPTPTFNYSPNTNYTTYNYDTVNNYDSTQNFNEWLGDTITTINNNLSGGLDSIDNNLRIIGDNINDFSTSVKNYIEGGGAAVSEYIGNLIIKFNNDFLGWTDSFGSYLGDVLGTINFNTQLIADNILNFIKVQFVPDDDYLNLLLMECCPWYYQVKDVLNEVISDSSAVDHLSINFSIPSLDYEGSAVFEDDELASLIRNTFQVILVAGTVIGCVRLGFQIFGINIKVGQGVE